MDLLAVDPRPVARTAGGLGLGAGQRQVPLGPRQHLGGGVAGHDSGGGDRRVQPDLLLPEFERIPSDAAREALGGVDGAVGVEVVEE